MLWVPCSLQIHVDNERHIVGYMVITFTHDVSMIQGDINHHRNHYFILLITTSQQNSKCWTFFTGRRMWICSNLRLPDSIPVSMKWKHGTGNLFAITGNKEICHSDSLQCLHWWQKVVMTTFLSEWYTIKSVLHCPRLWRQMKARHMNSFKIILNNTMPTLRMAACQYRTMPRPRDHFTKGL